MKMDPKAWNWGPSSSCYLHEMKLNPKNSDAPQKCCVVVESVDLGLIFIFVIGALFY